MCRIIVISFFLVILVNLTIATTTTTLTKKRTFKDSKISRIIAAPDNSNESHMEKSLHFPLDVTKADNKNVHTKKSIDNMEMFSKLGLSKLRISPSHHKKRLAVESRHHSRPDDSHMFVIKLPPNPYYYTKTGAGVGIDSNSISDVSQKVPVGFKSNGKPGRIYHWNIPVIKKAFGQNHHKNSNYRHTDDESDLFDIKNIPTWSKPWENESIDKPFGKNGKIHDKVLKKKSPIYYAPKQVKNNFHKYFPGNGKPQSFYVIEKSHKPAYYHKLIS